jgi:hypothetical protein
LKINLASYRNFKFDRRLDKPGSSNHKSTYKTENNIISKMCLLSEFSKYMSSYFIMGTEKLIITTYQPILLKGVAAMWQTGVNLI